MPMHPVTSTLMYRGICTIPDILSYSAPVNLPEDEVEGENRAPARLVFFFVWSVGAHVAGDGSRFAPPPKLHLKRALLGQHHGQRSGTEFEWFC